MVRAWLGGSFPLGGMLEAGMSAGTKRGGRRKWKRGDDKLRACGSRELGEKFFIWCVRGCGGEKKIKSGALLGVVVACSVSCLQRPACHEHWAKNTSLQDTILSLLSAPSSSSCFGHACI